MISADERISLLKAITNAFEDDEMAYDGNSINHFEKHMIKFLDELRKPGKDAEEAAKEYASKQCHLIPGETALQYAQKDFIAGWQAKESRDAEMFALLERAFIFIQETTCFTGERDKLIADFEKLKKVTDPKVCTLPPKTSHASMGSGSGWVDLELFGY